MNCECEYNVNSCIEIVPIFSSLLKEEMDEIAKIAIHKTYSKGNIIYSAGNQIQNLYVIHAGKIKISRLTSDGKEQVIRILGPGEFMGELSLFTQSSMTDYAEALEKVSICMIDGNELKKHMMKHPEISFKIIEEISKRLEIVESLVEGINLHSVEWRLAQFLLKRSNNNIVLLNTTKGNFASQLGMSQETLSRKLTLFQEKKWIKLVNSKKIAIINPQALEEIL